MWLNFVISLTCTTAAFLYVLLVIKEPKRTRKKSDKGSHGNALIKWLFRYIWAPLRDTVHTTFRRRPLRGLLWLMLATYGLYWFCLEDFVLMYYYLLDTFDGYEGTDFSLFLFMIYAEGAVASLILLPLLNAKLGVHESLTLTVICLLTSTSSLLSAFSKEIWQFYLAQSLRFANICTYALAR